MQTSGAVALLEAARRKHMALYGLAGFAGLVVVAAGLAVLIRRMGE